MKRFRTLAIVTAASVYGQIVLGGVVRITGSGLGCRDWPLCYQHESDRFAYRTLLEVSHRLFGTAAGLLVLATAVSAYVIYARARGPVAFPRGLWLTALAGLVLYGFQAVLGGVTVLMKNSPFTVAIHLGNALLVLGVILLVALWAGRLATGADRVSSAGRSVDADRVAGADRVPDADRGRTPVFAYGGMVAAFLVVVSGAYVVGSGASAACASWPLCGATSFGPVLVDTHMLHRVVVGIAGAFIIAAAGVGARRWQPTRMALVAYLTGVALLVEVAIGAFQVLSGLPQGLRALHLALATLVWSGTVLMGAAHWLQTRPEAASGVNRSRTPRPRAAEARG